MRMNGGVDGPFRSDGVKFIKEQDTRFGRDGSLKYVPYLYTVISSFLHKMEGRTHRFLTSADVLVQQFRTFDAYEI